jgi:hypothetical protein
MISSDQSGPRRSRSAAAGEQMFDVDLLLATDQGEMEEQLKYLGKEERSSDERTMNDSFRV